MSTHDANGRPWAKLSELRVGDKVMVDGGFICMKKGDVKNVLSNENGLYINCEDGTHLLRGQADDGEHLIGIYRLP